MVGRSEEETDRSTRITLRRKDGVNRGKMCSQRREGLEGVRLHRITVGSGKSVEVFKIGGSGCSSV